MLVRIVLTVSLVQIAKVEKLKPLEVELRRLEDLSESIVNDFAYMKKREEEMRDTNGKIQNFQDDLKCHFNRKCFVNAAELLQRSVCYLKQDLFYPVLIFYLSSLVSFRVHQHACAVLQHLLHVLSHRSGHVAGVLPASLLQGQEAH